MKHKAFEFKNPAQIKLEMPPAPNPEQVELETPPAPKKEDVVHEAIMLPTEIKEIPKTHKELMEDRKSEIIAYFELDENLINEIHFDEEAFSEDDLSLGCFIGKQSLHDYLEARAIEDLARQCGITEELFHLIRITESGPMLGNETFEEYRRKSEIQNKEYKQSVEKSQKKTKKFLQKYYPNWIDNYYDN